MPHILKRLRLELMGLFAIVTFLVYRGSLQAEPIAGKPPLTVVSRGAGAYKIVPLVKIFMHWGSPTMLISSLPRSLLRLRTSST
jgi:hypothetical protein